MQLPNESRDIDADAIQTELSYLVKDAKHEREMPYELRFNTKGALPQTNMVNETKPALIRNFRTLQNPPDFEKCGFASVRLEPALINLDFENKAAVEECYYPAVKKLLWVRYPQAHKIMILEHDLRKRHVKWPSTIGDEDHVQYLQPATSTHVGKCCRQ